MTASLDKKFFQGSKEKWANTQLDLTIKYNMLQFGVKNGKEVKKSDIDGGVQDNVITAAHAKGGDELLFVSEHHYEAWLDSCAPLPPLALRVSSCRVITVGVQVSHAQGAAHALLGCRAALRPHHRHRHQGQRRHRHQGIR